jgi:GDP-D-glucose phosphorylase
VLLSSGVNVSFIINNSPLTKYHVLIVPSIDSCQAQIMTRDCLEIALHIMTATDDKSIKIGYNSPGALASVNHLHLHLLQIDHELYVESVVSAFNLTHFFHSRELSHLILQELTQLADNFYKIDHQKYLIHGFCLIVRDLRSDVETLYKFVQYCCDKVIPHNIFFTKSSKDGSEMRVFFFPRQLDNFGTLKLYSTHLNVAFCELSGFIPIGDDELYESITEAYVLDRFNDEIGTICDEIESDLTNIVAKC